MRSILFAVLVAGGIGLLGTAVPTVAAPINGPAIGQTADNAVTQVQHYRNRSRRYNRRRGRYYHDRYRSNRRYHHNRYRSGRGRGCHVVPFSFWAPC